MSDNFQVSAQKVCQLSSSTFETSNSSENIENENVSGKKDNDQREDENERSANAAEVEVISPVVSLPVDLFSNLL